MNKGKDNNDLQEIITQALENLKSIHGENFSISDVSLADMERLTGISRQRLRTLKKNGFIIRPHGLKGKKSNNAGTVSEYSDIMNDLLKSGVRNASVIYDRLLERGYTGSKSSVKRYVSSHAYLVPAKRQIVSPQGNRGRRYETGPGECYQMDWGFVNAESQDGVITRIACFAMVCHHCGKRYIEFFPNAKQENLFIGMVHAFMFMGVPSYVLTDNMKSVVIRRDSDGHPVWQSDYELFMGNLGFETKLCKPRHPYTKGKVERLVRFVKDNFIAGRPYRELTDFNYEALSWCRRKDSIYSRCVDCIPEQKHQSECMKKAPLLEESEPLLYYLCPERRISFDGFVTYEGRRFGVPYWYPEKTCRVRRDGYVLYIYDSELSKILVTHDVTWSRKDSWCRDQYATEQPEEKPSVPVKVQVEQISPPETPSGFEKFNFWEASGNE